MLETIKKNLRCFKRDYWDGVEGTTPHTGPTRTLSSEIKVGGAFIALGTAAVALFFPPLLAVALAGGSTLFTAFAVRQTAKLRNRIAAQKVAYVPMASTDQDADDVYATLTGPASALRTVVNTQRMVDDATRKYGEYVIPEETWNKLAPHFNDCAAAAAQLTAQSKGKCLDSIPLTYLRTVTDDYDGFIVGHYRRSTRELTTGPGAIRKTEEAARQAATAAAVAGTKDGLDTPLTVKRIRLKVAA